MMTLDFTQLTAALALSRPLSIRTIAFDVPTFDKLKQFQRVLESRLRRDTGNAEVLKYLIYTQPEVSAALSDD
jgi:hypothetical protein